MKAQYTTGVSRYLASLRNFVFVLSMGLFSTPVIAEDEEVVSYGAIQMPFLSYEIPELNVTVGGNTYTLDDLDLNIGQPYMIRLGKTFGGVISLEVRYGFDLGLSDSLNQKVSVTSGGSEVFKVETRIDRLLGAYTRLGLSGEKYSPYILAGVTAIKTEFESPGNYYSSTSDSGLSYGYGIDFHRSDGDIFNIEWANLFDRGGVKLSGLLMGFTYRID